MLDMRDSHGASRWTNAYMFVRFCKGKLWIVAPIDVNEQPDQGSEFTVWSFCDCSTKSCSHLFTHTDTHTALYCVLEGRCRDRNLPTQPASPPQLQYKMSKCKQAHCWPHIVFTCWAFINKMVSAKLTQASAELHQRAADRDRLGAPCWMETWTEPSWYFFSVDLFSCRLFVDASL